MNEQSSVLKEVLVSAISSMRKDKGWAEQAIVQLPDDKLHVAIDPNINSIACDHEAR